jgi:hypothetical protein
LRYQYRYWGAKANKTCATIQSESGQSPPAYASFSDRCANATSATTNKISPEARMPSA